MTIFEEASEVTPEMWLDLSIDVGHDPRNYYGRFLPPPPSRTPWYYPFLREPEFFDISASQR